MTTEPEPGSLERSEELRAITERFWAATRRGDVEAVIARKSQLRGLTLFGPDAGEFIDDADDFVRYVRRLYEDDPSWGSTLGPPAIDAWVEGSAGWSISRIPVELSDLVHQLRATFVFHLERGDWRIVHEHWSFEAPQVTQQAWGQSYARTMELLSEAAALERPDVSAWTSDEGTVTLVFTDIEGSTALNASFGTARGSRCCAHTTRSSPARRPSTEGRS